MNSARLPVMVSIDFNSGPWTSRSECSVGKTTYEALNARWRTSHGGYDLIVADGDFIITRNCIWSIVATMAAASASASWMSSGP